MPSLIEFTQPLNANQTIVSGAQNISRATEITGTVFADQPGTIYIEQSGDAQNWDINISANVSANVGEAIEVSVIAQYFRIRYVNGSNSQTIFRLFADARDPYGAFLQAALAPSAGGAWAVLRWNPTTSFYTYVGRFDGLDGWNACGNAAVATNQSGKYAAFAVDNAVVSDETLLRDTEHSPDSF